MKNIIHLITADLQVVNNYPRWLVGNIAEHGCGVAVKPGDPFVFVGALERLAEETNLLWGMGKNAPKFGESEFSQDSLVDTFVNCLASVYWEIN